MVPMRWNILVITSGVGGGGWSARSPGYLGTWAQTWFYCTNGCGM
jgi:hypothetical protein